MKKEEKLRYIMYAIKNNANLTIETQNNKKYNIKEVEYNNERELLKYKYEKNNNDGKIRVENILDIQLADKQEERNYIYTLLEKHYGALNLKEKIENFEKYYLEIIDILFSKEQIGTKGYLNLKNKKNMYPHIFENLYKDKENLLFYYFSEKKIKKKQQSATEIENEKLLIEQANLSQKEALKNAINNKMSIIQGPPGTGKTTTILNILANLIYQNKNVLVVSKNNSAIENVAEELEKMEIPRSFIRMRKFRYNEKCLVTKFEKIEEILLAETLMIFALQKSLENACSLLYTALIGDDLRVFNNDNIFSIDKNYSNSLRKIIQLSAIGIFLTGKSNTVGDIMLVDCDPSPEYHMHEFGVIQSYSASFNGEMGDTSKVTMMVVDDLLNPYHLLTNRIIDMDFPPLVREELEDSKDKNISVKKKISRNEKCPCGSGLKYKFCCGKNK